MFGINKKTEETINSAKNDIKEQVNNLVEDGRVWSIGVLAVTCLTVGYILGSVTTSSAYRTISWTIPEFNTARRMVR